MRYKIGAQALEEVPSLVHRPGGVFGAARTVPVGPTHAVGYRNRDGRLRDRDRGLEVLNDDWEAACFVEKCPGCFAAVITHG